jgi:hypothetical protein
MSNNNYAVLIKSAVTANNPRETVVIPAPNGVEVWTRINTGSQGASNAWTHGVPAQMSPTELVLGVPVALEVTETDIDYFNSKGAWSTLTQRLVRSAKSQTALSTAKALDLIGQVVTDLTVNPQSGVAFTKGRFVASVPTTTVAPPAPAVPVTVGVSVASTAPQTASVSQPSLVSGMALLVPSQTDEDIAGYLPRILSGGLTERQMYDGALAGRHNILLKGDAGTGKSTSPRVYASLRGVPFYALDCNPQLDSLAVEGGYVSDGNGGYAWVDSPLVQALRQPSVVLLNESNRMSPKQQSYFMGMLAERVLYLKTKAGSERVDVHPECLIVTDYNPNYEGVVNHDKAFLDRFWVKQTFRPDRKIEEQLIRSKTLLDIAWQVRGNRKDFRRTPFTLRLLKAFQQQVDTYAPLIGVGAVDFAIDSLVESFDDPTEALTLRELVDLNKTNLIRDYNL